MGALLQTEQVVDGDAGECGEFFAAQPGGAPPSAGGQADVSRREAVAPGMQCLAQGVLRSAHDLIVVPCVPSSLVLPFHG